MDIQYGVKITTSQALTDYSLGLVGGVIQWITGRPAIDGWKEGLITKGSFSPVSQEIEITAGGSYATMSGFSLAVVAEVDGTPLWKRIQTLGLNLVQKEIVFYTFRDGVATQDWTGRVGDFDSDEHEFRIRAMDAFRSIHRPALTRRITTEEFASAPQDSLDKFVPVSLGRITHATLVNVRAAGEKTTLNLIGSVSFTVCAAKAYSEGDRTVDLYTEGVSFGANAPLLVGRYLRIFIGGSDQAIRIISNLATNTGTDITRVTLARPFDAAPNIWTSTSQTDQSVTYFEVAEFSGVLIVSSRPISSFENGSSGRPVVEAYDDSSKTFGDVNEVLLNEEAAEISDVGLPGVEVIVEGIEGNADLSVFTPIVPEDVSIHELFNAALSDGVIGSAFDQNRNTYVEFIATAHLEKMAVGLDVKIPSQELTKDYSEIFLLVNVSANSADPYNSDLEFNVAAVDLYGRRTTAIVGGLSLLPDIENTWEEEGANFVSLPGEYFGDSDTPQAFYTRRSEFAIQSLIGDEKKATAYGTLRVSIFIDPAGTINANTYIRLKEIGFVGRKIVNLVSDTLYSKVIGETFGSTWGGRKTAANPVLTIADAVEAIIRDFDGAPNAVDTVSFDALSHPSTGARRDWCIGRQLDGGAASFDLCQDLAQFGFFGIIPRNNGARAAKAWRGSAAVATHDAAVILHGSIGSRELTSLSRLYNAPQVNYAWNPGTEKYDLFLQITKIDEDQFPAEATLDGNGAALWRSYALGYNNDEYARAKNNWDPCHLSWQRYGLIQTLPDDMADASWFPDAEGAWGLPAAQNAAKLYMDEICQWTAFRKEIISYRLPNTATHAILELLDKVTFNDSFATDGESVAGWIVGKIVVPGDGSDGKDYIEVSVMLEPDTSP
jgi:hypothetical protein